MIAHLNQLDSIVITGTALLAGIVLAPLMSWWWFRRAYGTRKISGAIYAGSLFIAQSLYLLFLAFVEYSYSLLTHFMGMRDYANARLSILDYNIVTAVESILIVLTLGSSLVCASAAAVWGSGVLRWALAGFAANIASILLLFEFRKRDER